MSSCVELDEVRSMSQSVRERHNLKPLLNCGWYSEQLAEELNSRGINCQVKSGYITVESHPGPGAEHAWVEVSSQSVTNASHPVVVDITAAQFCDENKKEGRVYVTLGKREDIPDVICFEKNVRNSHSIKYKENPL